MLRARGIATRSSGSTARFPTLRWAFLEAGCGWLPFWLEQVHEHHERLKSIDPGYKNEEDIYKIFKDRCIVGAEGEDKFVNAAMDAGGEAGVVWASDYPHFDCVMPGLAQDVRVRTDLSDARKRKWAAENAVNFFGLKETAVQRTVLGR